jgi:A/G-specific adenine glycosylase
MNSLRDKVIKKEAFQLALWFRENARPLPWRKTDDPYKIWISEVMLQQTTVAAVIPYYEKFIQSFPNIKSLALSSLEKVYKHWAGLGYYSRARNIHKAAQAIFNLKKFPAHYKELINLPGFGDYTSRAVSSQAFGEKVGVVDGNVIRVLSRRFALKVEHWKTKEKKQLQDIADQYAQYEEPRVINQAFMELGATICTPLNPTCFLCPLQKNCLAYSKDLIKSLPLKKPKREFEIWHWNVELIENNGKLAFIQNAYAPFLKKQLILPGRIEQKKKKPKDYDLTHGITHHKIFIKINYKKLGQSKNKNLVWIDRQNLKEKIPFSLIQKTVDFAFKKTNSFR